jgi:hypothetical protein
MLGYRLFCFDGTSRIVSTDHLTAASDAEALREAKNKIAGRRGEIWEGDRLVARIAAPAHCTG